MDDREISPYSVFRSSRVVVSSLQMCMAKKKKSPEAVEACPPKSLISDQSQKLSGPLAPVPNATPVTVRSQSIKNSPPKMSQSAPNSVSRVTPGVSRKANVTPGAGSTSVSLANTPAGEQQKQETIRVEPPKEMHARRDINKVRDPKDPDYRTLEIGGSIWEEAEIVKRRDLKKDEGGKTTSAVMSRKSSRNSRKGA